MRLLQLSLVLVVLSVDGFAAETPFLRGDSNGDGDVTLADALLVADAVVARSPLPCADAADFNDNGRVNFGDAAFVIEYLLRGEPVPVSPFPQSGTDPSADALDCGSRDAPLREDGGSYALAIQSVGNSFRLRVSLENRVPVVGGHFSLQLPAEFAVDSRIVEIKPSLELSTYLKEDYLLFGEVGKDHRLRVIWLPSLPAEKPGVAAKPSRPFFDLLLCPGTTPVGDYRLEPAGSGELVSESGLPLVAHVDGVALTIQNAGSACNDSLILRGRIRHYAWMEDAEVQLGERFRVPFYTLSNEAYRDCQYRITWDPKVVRAVWVDKVRPETSVDAFFLNKDEGYQGEFPGMKEYTAPYYRLVTCDPCNIPSNSAAGSVSVRNYHLGDEAFRPFPADQESHQVDFVFEARPTAEPGESSIQFFEDPSTTAGGPGFQGDVEADNAISVPNRGVDSGQVLVKVKARPELPNQIAILPAGEVTSVFVRGDANSDGTLNLGDPVTVFNFLFTGAYAPLHCQDAGDGNDDGALDIGDGIYVLGFLFLGTLPPPPPYPAPGQDTTGDSLGCGT